jgi:hypothetical protein
LSSTTGSSFFATVSDPTFLWSEGVAGVEAAAEPALAGATEADEAGVEAEEEEEEDEEEAEDEEGEAEEADGVAVAAGALDAAGAEAGAAEALPTGLAAGVGVALAGATQQQVGAEQNTRELEI